MPRMWSGGDYRTLREGSLKFVWNSKGGHILWDLAADPGETRNVAADRPQAAGEMLARLEAYFANLSPPPDPGPARQVDAETQRALQELGYLE